MSGGSFAASFDVERAADFARPRLAQPVPTVGVVLGSGAGGFLRRVDAGRSIAFGDVPGLASTEVAGHEGRFVQGSVRGVDVLVQAGRVHLYEGHTPDAVVAPVRLMARLGVRYLIVTNAAGGIRSDLAPGSIVLIEDQIDWTFAAGTMGVGGWGTGGVTHYDAEMAELARRAALALGLKLPAGVYIGVLGPSFETPAEVRVLERFGAALVGMSTVLEVRGAVSAGVRTLGLSLVTNRAAGKAKHPLSHEEVLRVGAEAEDRLSDLLEEIVVRIATDYEGVTK